jgi:spore germination protein Q
MMNPYYNQQGFQAYPDPTRQQPSFGGQAGFPGAQSGGGMGIPPQAMGGPMGGGSQQIAGQVPGMLPIEQSYIENILRLNKGKLVTVFATFENNNQWNAKEFKGIIEAAGRDHVILSDPQTGMRFLIPMVHVDYVTFSEEIEYEYPYAGGPQISTYPPR